MSADKNSLSWKRAVETQKYWSGDGLVVCYDELTGDTHVVNEFAANLLDILSDEGVSTDNLCASIPNLSVPEEQKSDFLEYVNNILLDLCEYGLVERG